MNIIKYLFRIVDVEPDLLIVITGDQLGYTREDGVHIVPISALKP